MTGPVTPEKQSIWTRLYYGETELKIVGRWKTWFALSGAVILIGLLALPVRGGLNLGIDFTGGNVWQLPANGVSVPDATSAMEDLGFTDLKVQTVGDDLRIQSEPLTGSDAAKEERNQEVIDRLADLTRNDTTEVVVNQVGPSWGDEISSKAIRALVVFLIAITIYITLRFEFRMALATLAALFHDILVVIGVYAILQLPVTPATVIAILTILGFSIYDGIVVFDRVDENTRLLSGNGRLTYSGMVDLSLNEVLMRSLNTQITALLPIASVLLIGSFALGASTLEEFGLALFVGQLSGAYSSLFIASPALALLKEREPRYRTLRKRLEERGEILERRAARTGAAPVDSAGDDTDAVVAGTAPAPPRPTAGRPVATPSGAIPPRPRKKGKRR